MQIKYAPKFQQRLEEIAEYIYKKTGSRTATVSYIQSIESHISLSLEEFPKLGRPVDEFGTGVRKLVHQRYSILYIIKEHYILVLTIYRENLPKL